MAQRKFHNEILDLKNFLNFDNTLPTPFIKITTMKATTKNIFRYSISTLAGLMMILFVACEETEIQPADLRVYVNGTLSGKPRENIKVNLYDTKADAENELNPVTVYQYTDVNGFTIFYGLVSHRRYWVRADALLSRRIKETQKLGPGLNQFSLSIL